MHIYATVSGWTAHPVSLMPNSNDDSAYSHDPHLVSGALYRYLYVSFNCSWCIYPRLVHFMVSDRIATRIRGLLGGLGILTIQNHKYTHCSIESGCIKSPLMHKVDRTIKAAHECFWTRRTNRRCATVIYIKTMLVLDITLSLRNHCDKIAKVLTVSNYVYI